MKLSDICIYERIFKQKISYIFQKYENHLKVYIEKLGRDIKMPVKISKQV